MQESTFRILEVRDEIDGSATVVMDIEPEFVKWFCRKHGLKKFSQDKFNEWVLKALNDYIDKHKLV